MNGDAHTLAARLLRVCWRSGRNVRAANIDGGAGRRKVYRRYVGCVDCVGSAWFCVCDMVLRNSGGTAEEQ
ncbi:uncharacterized protein SPSK_10578 [Sporothrix schenckii 1099-18]|uniref:Uncharacterized protein n=1 Tax=Sporothrix schenckii 1099-18 TaxID=1397361 RepID=A0A0F2M255_SPOSC|nr:uncharacterized protein SPSK_10578 [Sporothrix schenckii 1099-18]KJR83793.1 hypothetical protein SPSK_10578 [Sporothrix schenckii 1099-18]